LSALLFTCFALAKLETQTCFALAKLETQTCFALAKLETQTCCQGKQAQGLPTQNALVLQTLA
jgi:hypothetical protein